MTHAHVMTHNATMPTQGGSSGRVGAVLTFLYHVVYYVGHCIGLDEVDQCALSAVISLSLSLSISLDSLAINEQKYPIVRARTNRYKNSFVLYGLSNLQCSAL